MPLKIAGLDDFQKQLDQAAKALQSLDGEVTTLKFNPDDPASVEGAVVQMEQAIDLKIAPYRGNQIIEKIAVELKNKYRQTIHDRAAAARLQREGNPMSSNTIDPAIFRQVENSITDLQSADYNTFERHIKKLARLLHSSQLESITSALTSGIDLDAWVAAGEATARTMVGALGKELEAAGFDIDWNLVMRPTKHV
jgi:hypothetical protein